MDVTDEERRRASAFALEAMVIALWTHVLRQDNFPTIAGSIIAERTTADFEWLLSHAKGRDAEVTQHLAIAAMERMWIEIRRGLPSPPDEDAPA